MVKKIVVCAMALTILAACAKEPDAIPAADIGKGAYRGMSCKNLRLRKVELDQSLANLSASQKDAAAGDAVGVILLGLPLSSMSGGDKETAIAVTKGHIQEIEREQAHKGCATT